MASDPHLLDAFRRQCRSFGPETFMVWRGQRGVEQDDLIDIMKEEVGHATEQQRRVRQGTATGDTTGEGHTQSATGSEEGQGEEAGPQAQVVPGTTSPRVR